MILIIIALVQACPIWQCAELEVGVCAEWDEKTVKVNTNQCPPGQFCYLLGLELEKSWNVEGKTLCEDFELDLSNEPINCWNAKAKEKSLKKHPIRCQLDKDCGLESGKNKDCVCAMDGNSYCEIAESDPELELFNINCEVLTNTETFAWHLFIDLFPILHKVPKCATSLFRDLKFIADISYMLKLDHAFL